MRHRKCSFGNGNFSQKSSNKLNELPQDQCDFIKEQEVRAKELLTKEIKMKFRQKAKSKNGLEAKNEKIKDWFGKKGLKSCINVSRIDDDFIQNYGSSVSINPKSIKNNHNIR